MTYLSIHLSVVASNVDSTTILQKLYILAINVRSLLKAEIDQLQLFRSCTATAGGPMILIGSNMCATQYIIPIFFETILNLFLIFFEITQTLPL